MNNKKRAELIDAARRAGEGAIERRHSAGLSVSGLGENGKIVRYTRAQAERVGAHQDDATPLADAVQAHAEPLACQVCGKPAKKRNISGFEDVLCNDCYQFRLSMENDHWNN